MVLKRPRTKRELDEEDERLREKDKQSFQRTVAAGGLSAGGLNVGRRKKKREDEIINQDINANPLNLPNQTPLTDAIARQEFLKTDEGQGITRNEAGQRVAPDGTILSESAVFDPNKRADTSQVFRDDTGQIIGVVDAQGKALFGFENREAENLISRRQTREATPAGFEEAGLGTNLANITEQIGQTDQLTPAQLAAELEHLDIPTNLKQAIAGILTSVATDAAAGAAGGAVIGTISSPATGGVSIPVAVAVGAAGGAVVGTIRGITRELKAESGEDLDAANAEFKGARKAMKLVVSDVNQKRIDPSEAVRLFNLQQNKINRVERQMKELTRNDLNDYLSGGSTRYAQIVEFQSAGGEGEVLALSLAGAIQKPNPDLVYIPDIEDNPDF